MMICHCLFNVVYWFHICLFVSCLTNWFFFWRCEGTLSLTQGSSGFQCPGNNSLWLCFILRRNENRLVARSCNEQHNYMCEQSKFHSSCKRINKFYVKHLVIKDPDVWCLNKLDFLIFQIPFNRDLTPKLNKHIDSACKTICLTLK